MLLRHNHLRQPINQNWRKLLRMIPNTSLLSLPEEMYKKIVEFRKTINLDFDDAYQYGVAKYFGLKIVTMDRDFEKVKDVEVEFLQDVA